MSIATLAGEFPCTEEGCDKVFDSAQALQGHVMWHGRKPSKKIPCPECAAAGVDAKYYEGTGMSQHRKARHGVRNGQAPVATVERQAALVPTPPAPKRGRPARNRIDLNWTTDDIFNTVITALWPGGNIPVDAVLPLIQWRENTREFLEKVRSE